MGADRPSPDHANADVIYLISAHLEAGHYFNPHAQRIIEARSSGAKLIVLDTRLSNTATHADHWLSPLPGSEAAINLAVAQHLIVTGRYNREFVRQWWNWEEYLQTCHPSLPSTFEAFENVLAALYDRVHLRVRGGRVGHRRREAGGGRRDRRGRGHSLRRTRLAVGRRREPRWLAGGAAPCSSSRRCSARSATEGGTFPNGLEQVRARADPHAAASGRLAGADLALEYPLAQNEMSFLLPHFLAEGRGKLDTYFIRVYNPVWTNPDGLSWMEVLTDESKIGCFVALTPTWSESAYFADYVLAHGTRLRTA